MKKAIILLLAVLFAFGIAGCKSTQELNEYETELYNAIILDANAYFYTPSAVRLLEVRNYSDSGYSLGYPKIAVVKLQGENRLGGTTNAYVLICVAASGELDAEKQEEYDSLMELYKEGGGAKYYAQAMQYQAKFGEMCVLDDAAMTKLNWGTEKAKSLFDVGNINRALDEYWKSQGF